MTIRLIVLEEPFQTTPLFSGEVDTAPTVDLLFKRQSAVYTGPTERVVCAKNGKIINFSDWKKTKLVDGDTVLVFPRPLSFSPLEIFLILIVAVFAVSALTSISPIDAQDNIPEQSPTYNLDAQGNKARLGKVIPVRYGKFKVYPDFASEPYRRYANDDQYLYQLFSLGHGEFDYEDLKIGDTPVENFDEITYEFYLPGQKVTLFRDAVNVSPDVTNTTLFAPNESEYDASGEYEGYSGPFIANDVGTKVVSLAVDVVMPGGLYSGNKKGGLDSRSVAVSFEYRDVYEGSDIENDDGDYRPWRNLAFETYRAATVDAIRKTIEAPVFTETGRVEVRGVRLSNSSSSARVKDEIRWVGLKAYLDSDQTYDQSILAVKAKATDNLSSRNERLFNLVLTRKLPVWDGSVWLPLAATRNPAWAFCDALKSYYGGSYNDENLDLVAIRDLADVWSSRGDTFDGQFDTKSTLWASLKKICAVGRSYPTQFGKKFSIIRDAPGNPNIYQFNGRNIKANSTKLRYLTLDEFSDDSVEVEYVDPSTWKVEYITASVPGSPALKPKKVRLFGCTDKMQAHREAMFLAAKQEYRNIVMEVTTELDGRILNYLDRALVVQELSKWGTGGEVISVSGNTLTLSEPVLFSIDDGVHEIYLRSDEGKANGPYSCTETADENEVRIVGDLPEFIYTGDQKEKTYFAFSSPESKPREMLVETVKISGETEVKVQFVIDNPIVHSFDSDINSGSIPTPDPTPVRPIEVFVISNLVIVQGGTGENPVLQLSWTPAENAVRYFVDISYDAGDTWTRSATVVTNGLTINVLPGVVDIRVAPYNESIGSWFQQQVTTGSTFQAPPAPTGLALTIPFTGIKVDVDWDVHSSAVSWVVEVIDLSSNVRHEETLTTNNFTYSHAQASVQGIGREFDISVQAVNFNGIKSPAAVLRVKNQQTATLTNVTVTGLIELILVQWDPPSELDNVSFNVYASLEAGFEPGPDNLIETGLTGNTFSFNDNTFSLYGPDEIRSPWYVIVSGVDLWDSLELNYSDEVSTATILITDSNIGNYVADAAIGSAQIGTAAIGSAHIGTAAIQSAHVGTAAIGSAHIGTAAIQSAHIRDLRVDTLRIADRAVTNPVSVYHPNEIHAAFSTTAAPTTVVASYVYDCTGHPLQIVASLEANLTLGERQVVTCEIRRDGAVIATTVEGAHSSGIRNPRTVLFVARDLPTAGQYTYTITASARNLYSTITHRYLAITEFKR